MRCKERKEGKNEAKAEEEVGLTYPPANLAKLGFLSTLDMERALLLPPLWICGANAAADVAKIRDRAAVNFMVDRIDSSSQYGMLMDGGVGDADLICDDDDGSCLRF